MVDFTYFLSETMVRRGGHYNFPNLMMRCPNDTLVFFQYDGVLVACATLIDKFKGLCYDENGNAYAGRYFFDMSTMTIFSNPITIDKMRDVVAGIGFFSQCKQLIDLKYLPDIIQLINKAI